MAQSGVNNGKVVLEVSLVYDKLPKFCKLCHCVTHDRESCLKWLGMDISRRE